MSEGTVAARAAWRQSVAGEAAARWQPPDRRRLLQLALAAVWLLDAVLQYQSYMFTQMFGWMLAGTAGGNPAVIADPITWNAHIVEHHSVVTNAVFAAIQLALALGIAWRPTVQAALAASIAWSLGVWWFGEGLGGVLSGTADPVSGAPGAVIIYALLAVLLWPVSDGKPQASFVAGRPLGVWPARAAWLVLWGSLAWIAVQAANRTAQGLHDMISAMAAGEPGWLAALDRGTAGLLAHRGLPASIALAVVLAVIAAGICLPVPGARCAIAFAVIVSLAIWVAGQNFGGVLTGSATDPNSGLLLALLAAAYWPARTPAPAPAAAAPAPAEPGGGQRPPGS